MVENFKKIKQCFSINLDFASEEARERVVDQGYRDSASDDNSIFL